MIESLIRTERKSRQAFFSGHELEFHSSKMVNDPSVRQVVYKWNVKIDIVST